MTPTHYFQFAQKPLDWPLRAYRPAPIPVLATWLTGSVCHRC